MKIDKFYLIKKCENGLRIYKNENHEATDNAYAYISKARNSKYIELGISHIITFKYPDHTTDYQSSLSPIQNMPGLYYADDYKDLLVFYFSQDLNSMEGGVFIENAATWPNYEKLASILNKFEYGWI